MWVTRFLYFSVMMTTSSLRLPVMSMHWEIHTIVVSDFLIPSNSFLVRLLAVLSLSRILGDGCLWSVFLVEIKPVVFVSVRVLAAYGVDSLASWSGFNKIFLKSEFTQRDGYSQARSIPPTCVKRQPFSKNIIFNKYRDASGFARNVKVKSGVVSDIHFSLQ